MVHTYGREELESFNYNKYLMRTFEAAKNKNNFKSFGGNIFGLVIGIYYGYCFSMGGLLRYTGFKTYNGSLISGGEIVSVIFLIMLSTISIAGAGANMPSISGAKVAGKMALDVIDHVPGILPNEIGAKVVKREEMKGKIEFEDVCFNYPSNPDLKVLKNLTITFEAGNSIGLIGPSGSGKSTII